MKVLRARNVHQALPLALAELKREGLPRESRNGPVVVFPEPVTTVYEKPAERVLFWAERDANPFFHFYESLWMLAGRRDVEGPAAFVATMRNFSDDGVTFHGAYGWRWRSHFGRDQLPPIIAALRDDPNDRRQVLSMWDARADLDRKGKDLPCNLQAIFQINTDGRLDMTVTNRSNDVVWGAYGANAVHFSYLHEFMARAIGVEQGVYRQMSNNLHAYVETLTKVERLAHHVPDPLAPQYTSLDHLDPYALGQVAPSPLMTLPWAEWLEELDMFLAAPSTLGMRDPFFRRVAGPIFRAFAIYKTYDGESRFSAALGELESCAALDWRKACSEWIERRWATAIRKAREKRAKDDGVAYE